MFFCSSCPIPPFTNYTNQKEEYLTKNGNRPESRTLICIPIQKGR